MVIVLLILMMVKVKLNIKMDQFLKVNSKMVSEHLVFIPIRMDQNLKDHIKPQKEDIAIMSKEEIQFYMDGEPILIKTELF